MNKAENSLNVLVSTIQAKQGGETHEASFKATIWVSILQVRDVGHTDVLQSQIDPSETLHWYFTSALLRLILSKSLPRVEDFC